MLWYDLSSTQFTRAERITVNIYLMSGTFSFARLHVPRLFLSLATTVRTKAAYFEESEHNGLFSNCEVKAKFGIFNMGSIIVLHRQ